MARFNRAYRVFCTKKMFLMSVCGLENGIKKEVTTFSAERNNYFHILGLNKILYWEMQNKLCGEKKKSPDLGGL